MAKKNLNSRLEQLSINLSSKKARRALRLFSKISKVDDSELLEKAPEESDISSGLAQSVLYTRGHDITEFKGPYAGAFIIVIDDREYSFEGRHAGRESYFKGNYVGAKSSFEGEFAGAKSSFEGTGTGRESFFKGYCAGIGVSFEGRGSGVGSFFEGKYAGDDVEYGGKIISTKRLE